MLSIKKVFTHPIKQIFFVIFILLVFWSFSILIKAQTPQEAQLLPANQRVERELRGGQSHSYNIYIKANELLKADVIHTGVDIIVILLDPNKKQLWVKKNSLTIYAGLVQLSYPIKEAGKYEIQISALEEKAETGKYNLYWEIPRLKNEYEIQGAKKLEVGNSLYKKLFKDSVNKYFEALEIYKLIQNREGEAVALNNAGFVYEYFGEKQKALEFYNKALAIDSSSVDDIILINIGSVQYDLGDKQAAFASFKRVLNKKLSEQNPITLNNIGLIYFELGEKAEALKYYKKALLTLQSKEGYRIGNGEVEPLTVYKTAKIQEVIGGLLGKFGGAAGKRSVTPKWLIPSTYILPSKEFAYSPVGEAILLNNIGAIYTDLGESTKSFEYYDQALSIQKSRNDKKGQSTTLLNIGAAYSLSGKKDKALDYYQLALPIQKEVSDEIGQAATLSNIGVIYFQSSNKTKAVESFNEALSLYKKNNDKQGEGITLNNLGTLYLSQGKGQIAVEYLNKALIVVKAVKHKTSEAKILSNLMILWEQEKEFHLAIFYGKQSINKYQELRQNIQDLDKETQKTYLKIIEETYQKLADILISEGRFPEAQKVLSLLKEEEYFEYVRRDANEIKNLKERITLKADEQKLIERYNLLADKVTAIGTEFQKLDDKKRKLPEGASLSADEQKQYETLSAQLSDANAAFKLFLEKELVAELGKSVKKEIEIDRALQNKLRTWGDGTVALFTIAGEDRYRVVLTTPTVQVDGKTEIKSADLNKKIFAFREALQNPSVDPRPMGKELYDILIKPIEKDLIAANAKTLLWSLDGTLRYIPISALSPDSKSYLVEKYQNVVITSTTRQSLMAETEKDWKALGVGVSLAQTVADPILPDEKISFVSLPSVKTELAAIVRDEQSQNEKGLLSGKSFIDADFNRKNFSDFLTRETTEGKRKYPIVHIASHFRLGDNSANSFLLLGDGKTLTLEQISNSPEMTFENVELVTLSACNTAFGANSDSTGKEVDSLATFIELRGAKSIMATLWSVADESTSLIMSEFYRLHKENAQMTKAEAMQKAQTAMIEGKLKSSGKQPNCRSDVVSLNGTKQTAFKCDANAPFSHPYYWSPFVLIGNWR